MKTKKIGVGVVGLLAVLLFAQICAAQIVIDMDFKDAPLGDVFQVLGELAGYNVLIDQSVTGNISFYLKNLTVDEALELLTQATGYAYRIVNNTMIVATPARLAERFESSGSAFVVLKNVSAEEASRLLQVIAPGVQTYIDRELNILVLFGSFSEIDYAQDILEKYDSLRTTQRGSEANTGEQLITKAIYVEYGNGLEIVNILRRAFPKREFAWNPELRMLSGSALDQEWEQIYIIVAAKDHPAFVLRGLVKSNDRVLVLIEHEGKTTLMKPGDSLLGWIVERVADQRVFLKKDDRSFTLELGRQ